MSAISIVRSETGIAIATDGIGYDSRGVVQGHVSKVAIMPEWSCAFANRGAGGACSAMHHALVQLANRGVTITGFDEVLALMPPLSVELHAALQAEGRPYPHFSFMLGGFSTERDRFETHSLRSRDFTFAIGEETIVQAAYTLAPLPESHFAPTPSEDACKAAGLVLGGSEGPPEDGRHIAIRGVCAARLDKGATPDEPADEDYSVGGFVQLTTIFRDCITSEIVHRWPDPFGEKVDPTRGDLLPGFLRG